VDPNVTRILFGVALHGTGRAWFDELTISVDESSKVEAAPWPDRPPRPQYSQALLDDTEMSVEPDPDAPEENSSRATWVRENHRPIRSLLAEDYSDLAFLEPLLQGKRIVQLGESSHGAAEFNLARVRLIKFLHAELGFDVVVFESSLYECYRANSRVASQEPDLTMRQCLFSIWHTSEVAQLFEYIRESRETERPLLFGGIDIQESSTLGAAGRPEFFNDLLEATDPEYAGQVLAMDSEFRAVAVRSNKILAQFLTQEGPRLAEGYRKLGKYLMDNAEQLREANPGKEEELLVARQTADSLARVVGQRSAEFSSVERVDARGQGMALNLDFILNELYPGKKVVVWAHNAHIRHRNDAVEPDPSRTMGSWVAEGHRDELYTIGLYMYRGHATLNDRSLYEITPVVAGSLESILHRPLKKYLFVDLAGQSRNDGTAWMFEPITAKSWGKTPKTMTLRDQYDGILFVDTTTPPEYLLR
jgi:erythromycin esterase